MERVMLREKDQSKLNECYHDTSTIRTQTSVLTFVSALINAQESSFRIIREIRHESLF